MARIRVSLPAQKLLAALGGPEFCVLAGAVLGAASVGTITVLDGLATSVAALLAVRIEPAAAAYLVAGQRSRERAHERVLEHLGLEPLLDLRLRAGEGVGAALASSMLLSALHRTPHHRPHHLTVVEGSELASRTVETTPRGETIRMWEGVAEL